MVEETRLKKLHSFVHASDNKITSLTVSIPQVGESRASFLTFSDKLSKFRVKLSLDEIAGLSSSLENGKEWSAFHTYEDSKTQIQYTSPYISAQRDNKKITLKLSENERASLGLTLKLAFLKLLK